MTNHEIPNSSERSLMVREDRYFRVARFQGSRLLFCGVIRGKSEMALELVLVAVTPSHVNYFLADGDVQKSAVTRNEIIQFLDQYDVESVNWLTVPMYGDRLSGKAWYYCKNPPDFGAKPY